MQESALPRANKEAYTPFDPHKYLSLFRARRSELLNRPGVTNATEHLSVSATFSLALARVEQVHPASADLLRLCAFLAPDAIPIEILTEGAEHLGDILGPAMQDDLARDEVIRWAHRWSLLEYDAREGSLSVHRLVQAVVRETIDKVDEATWTERAVLAVNCAFPKVEFTNWPLCEELLPHARMCALLIDEYAIETESAARLLNQTGYYVGRRAQYAAAEPLYQRALAIKEKVFGPEHPDTATSLNNLAFHYAVRGDFAAAEPLFRRAVAILESALGREHPNTVAVRDNYADLLRMMQ
jgi:tetratricopeptide (TPR) repeat protein